ncbi:hypothetical protein [Archangium minus]|uniref:hypothetical protein n=1 Tax=Archangium minus TaxID=83450 RepID=UPI0037BE984B
MPTEGRYRENHGPGGVLAQHLAELLTRRAQFLESGGVVRCVGQASPPVHQPVHRLKAQVAHQEEGHAGRQGLGGRLGHHPHHAVEGHCPDDHGDERLHVQQLMLEGVARLVEHRAEGQRQGERAPVIRAQVGPIIQQAQAIAATLSLTPLEVLLFQGFFGLGG